MNFKITTLVENTVSVSKSLIGEHGFSVLIETGHNKVLFDTGQGLAVEHNAKTLGIDFTTIHAVSLSHGHYDHSGGLNAFLNHNSKLALFSHPDIFDKKLIQMNGKHIPIGISTEKWKLDEAGIQLHFSEEAATVCPGIQTTGEIWMKTDFESVEPEFFIENGNEIIPDTFRDENALFLDTDKGIVVILGCAHRGVINTLNHVRELTGKKTIHAVIGGLHLMKADPAKMKIISNCLREFQVEKLVVGHCTGFGAMAYLKNEFGGQFIPNSVGNVLQF